MTYADKIRVLICAVVFAAVCGNVYAQKEPVYISPNNDGIQDVLTIPFKIKDKRYITDWSLVITDSAGNIVRTIGNKETRPDRITFVSFFKRLFAAKEGVQIPDSVTWNGVFDSGETAADGTYYYYITAGDDNGNRAKTDPLTVIVDNTPPEIVLKQPADTEKIFGAGKKALFDIEQSGSAEDLWTGEIRDSAGTAVRTFLWENAVPASFGWDGRNDKGFPVEDGVYSYTISSADRAGNVSAAAAVSNIIYSGEKPSVGILLTGHRYFSPNGDGVQDEAVFDISIAEPADSGNRLVKWSVNIADVSGSVVRSFSGTGSAPKRILFDGRADDGRLLPEGEYQAAVSASYLNGYETAPVHSPVIILDNTAPDVSVRLSSAIFSPDGDGKMDTLRINQEVSKEAEWSGEILNAEGGSIIKLTFGNIPPSVFEWDGINRDGVPAADGFYMYRISAVDKAGNSVSVTSDRFELNTGTTEVLLTALSSAFSPNGDGVQDTIVFRPTVKTAGGADHYKFTVYDADGSAVKTTEASGTLPSQFVWDGKSDGGSLCGDGVYVASLETVSKNGSTAKTSARPILLDTVYPSAALDVSYTVFSPDGDGLKDSLPVSVSSSEEDLWTLSVADSSGNPVREIRWFGTAESFEWDGSDNAGNIVADGVYRMELASADIAGNGCSVSVSDIIVDTRETRAYFTSSETAISPNGDGFKDTQTFSVTASVNDGIESWSFILKNEDGAVLREWDQEDSANIPSVIVWDGLDSAGRPAETTVTPELSVKYIKGNMIDVAGSRFISTVKPPELTVRTSPRYFSPDNDGVDDDLFISLSAKSAVAFKDWYFEIRDPQNGSVFWNTSGKSSITERIVWDGRGNNGELVQSAMDYPFTFSVSDELGMSSKVDGLISVDVLVIRVGDVLKMQVPAIIFRADNADFKGRNEEPKNGLTQAQIDNNMRVLKRIAEILNKFKDYSVRIEGHANNITGTEAEETSTANGNIPLTPLSEARAETVRKILIEFGVSGSRLSTVGMGGRQPVVPRSDKDNWWKNRRVEFILEK